jgi:hypothetical protein
MDDIVGGEKLVYASQVLLVERLVPRLIHTTDHGLVL